LKWKKTEYKKSLLNSSEYIVVSSEAVIVARI